MRYGSNSMTCRVRMRTVQQLRTGAPPNVWERAWLFFFVDHWHHYYMILKDDGLEVGKKDNEQQLDEQWFFVATDPSVLVPVGQWADVEMSLQGQRLTVKVNGTLVADIMDNGSITNVRNGVTVPIVPQSPVLAEPKAIGLYVEDSLCEYGPVYVTQP